MGKSGLSYPASSDLRLWQGGRAEPILQAGIKGVRVASDNQMTCPTCGQRTATDTRECQWCDRPLDPTTTEIIRRDEAERLTDREFGCGWAIVIAVLLLVLISVALNNAFENWPI